MTGAPQYYLAALEELDDLQMLGEDIATHGGEGDHWCILQHIKARPATTSAGEVLGAKRLFLGKIADRVRHEFCQDDDDEYYLCAEDFENVLDELTQELMDEAEEELQQQQAERER